MPSKYLKDYVESKNNKQTNYEQILSRVEGVSKMNVFKMKFTKVLATAVAMLIVMIGIPQVYAKIQWNIEFKEYQNRNYETGFGMIKDDGYTEAVEMDNISQDGIKAKVESLFITDDEFKAKINFEFDENIVVDSENFIYGFAVYDEDKNIYAMNLRIPTDKNSGKENKKKSRYILEDIGAKYDKRDIFGNQLANQWGIDRLEAIGRNIVTEINIHSVKGFPRSKKVFIRIFDLGYDMFDKDMMESFNISDSEWIFEIDVPEKFYERLTTNLELKENIPGVKLSKLAVTEHGLQITGTFEGINDIIFQGKDMPAEEWTEKQNSLLYITDENGNRYHNIGFGTYTEGKDSIHANFEVTKSIFEISKLYLNYTDKNGKFYTVELVKQ